MDLHHILLYIALVDFFLDVYEINIYKIYLFYVKRMFLILNLFEVLV